VTRAVLANAAFATLTALSLMPEACNKMLGKQPPPSAEPDAPTPVPVPITSATTPPIWHPPDPVTPVSATGTTSSAAAPASPELVKARAASEAKEFKKVRTLLEKKVRAGKSLPEENQLVFRACVALKDKVCSDTIKAKHPDDVSE
jgi:hypothetical protein